MEDIENAIAQIARALHSTLVSPNESDSNFEPANVVDGLFAIARGLNRVALAIENHGDPVNESEPF